MIVAIETIYHLVSTRTAKFALWNISKKASVKLRAPELELLEFAANVVCYNDQLDVVQK